MSDRLVFVLHVSADADYAARLAVALSPMNAFPLVLQENGAPRTRIGPGGVSVLVLSDALSRAVAGDSDRMVADHCGSDVLICKLAAGTVDADVPLVVATGDTAVDGPAIAEALKLLELAHQDRAGGEKSAPRLGGAPTGRSAGRMQLAVRSAYGLAATLSIAGALAPAIVDRAQAVVGPQPVGLAEHEIETTSVQSSLSTPSSVIASPTPALDEWLTDETPQVSLAEPAPTSPVLAVDRMPNEVEISAAVVFVDDEMAHFVPAQMREAEDPKRAAFAEQRRSVRVKAEAGTDSPVDLAPDAALAATDLGHL